MKIFNLFMKNIFKMTKKKSVSTRNKHNRVGMLCFTTSVNHSKTHKKRVMFVMVLVVETIRIPVVVLKFFFSRESICLFSVYISLIYILYTILPKVLGRPLLMNRFDYFSNFYEYKS